MGYDEETKDYREQLDFKDSESTRQTEGFRNDRENMVDLSYLVKLFNYKSACASTSKTKKSMKF